MPDTRRRKKWSQPPSRDSATGGVSNPLTFREWVNVCQQGHAAMGRPSTGVDGGRGPSAAGEEDLASPPHVPCPPIAIMAQDCKSWVLIDLPRDERGWKPYSLLQVGSPEANSRIAIGQRTAVSSQDESSVTSSWSSASSQASSSMFSRGQGTARMPVPDASASPRPPAVPSPIPLSPKAGSSARSGISASKTRSSNPEGPDDARLTLGCSGYHGNDPHRGSMHAQSVLVSSRVLYQSGGGQRMQGSHAQRAHGIIMPHFTDGAGLSSSRMYHSGGGRSQGTPHQERDRDAQHSRLAPASSMSSMNSSRELGGPSRQHHSGGGGGHGLDRVRWVTDMPPTRDTDAHEPVPRSLRIAKAGSHTEATRAVPVLPEFRAPQGAPTRSTPLYSTY